MPKKTITKKTPDGKVFEVMEIEDPDQQNSIEISKNAKGEMSYRIKVYKDDPDQMRETLQAYKSVAEEKCRAP